MFRENKQKGLIIDLQIQAVESDEGTKYKIEQFVGFARERSKPLPVEFLEDMLPMLKKYAGYQVMDSDEVAYSALPSEMPEVLIALQKQIDRMLASGLSRSGQSFLPVVALSIKLAGTQKDTDIVKTGVQPASADEAKSQIADALNAAFLRSQQTLC